jgi:phage gp29-like protein
MGTELVAADGVTPLRQLMTREIAAPAMSSQRSIISGNPAAGLDPVRLAQILRGADDGNMIDYLELAEQIEERDLHYAAVLGTRKRQVSQLDVTVEAASDAPVDQAKAELIRDWLTRDALESEFFDILDAVGKGFSFTEIVWTTPANGPWLPERLIWRDPRWFEFDRIDGTTPLLRQAGQPTPLPPFKFIAHVHGNKSGLPVRGGLARAAAWAFLFKSFSLKDWLEFAEVYGFPIRVGKYQPGATDDQIRTLLRAVSQIGRDGAAAIPSSMAMDFESAGGTQGPDVFERLCRYMDEQLSKLVLGQTATTDSQGGGLGGSGKEHNDVRGDIERADAKLLAATINRDLVRPIIDLNFPAVPGALYPRVKIGRPEAEDLDAFMTGVERFVKMGGKVAVSVVRDKLQLPDPAAGEALLAAPAADLNAAATSQSPANPGPANLALPAPPPAPAAPFPAETASAGLLGPLKPSHGAVPPATAAANGGAAPEGDEIDAATQALLDDGWEPVMTPIVAPLLAALGTAASYDEAVAALAPALAAMKPDELARRLLAGAFAVRAEAAADPGPAADA